MRDWKKTSAIVAAVTVAGVTTAATADSVMTFDSLQHGQIVNNQIPGVTISAHNASSGPDLAVAFDSTERQTRDPDLEGPNANDSMTWDGGNIDADEQLGNMLIVQENNVGTRDGIADLPDDEGSMPSGSITFEFDSAISGFGFDLIDFEGQGKAGNVKFFNDGDHLKTVTFSALAASDPSIDYGNNSANRIAPPLTVNPLNGPVAFNKVIVNLSDSAGLDNITTTTAVPTPTAAGGLILMGGGLLLRRRMRRV